MRWLYLCSCVSLIIGLLFGYRTIARNRRPQPAERATLTWHERQRSLWQQDFSLALCITVHGSGIVLLAIMFFLLIHHPQAKISITWDVILVGMFISWIAGSLLAFPFAVRFAPAFPMRLFSNAAVRGQFFAEWSAFSHFTADSTTQVIRLFSARTPEVARAIWQPPTPQLFVDVVTFLSHYLPTTMPTTPLPWYRRRNTLMMTLLLSTTGLVLAGLAIYIWALGWVWPYYLLAMTALLISGGWLLQKFEVS